MMNNMSDALIGSLPKTSTLTYNEVLVATAGCVEVLFRFFAEQAGVPQEDIVSAFQIHLNRLEKRRKETGL